MKIKISELSGRQLDWAVAYINSLELQHDMPIIERDKHNAVWLFFPPNPFNDYRELWQPTNDWSQAGPIIEKIEGLQVKGWLESKPELKFEVHIHNYEGDWIQFGSNIVEAAMRCYVASKMGDEVEIPEELL